MKKMAEEKKKIAFYTNLVKICVLLRLIFGPAIFIAPRITALVSFMLDWVDGELFKRAGYARNQYSFYDKLLDYYWYIWILIYIFANNVPFKDFFVFLFLFRTLGQFLYMKYKKEYLLLLFPNIFEIFFIYYLIVRLFGSYSLFFLSPPILWISLLVILIFVLVREYILHIKQANLSSIFMGRTTYWLPATKNPYKVLGFLILVFTIIISYQIINQTDKLSYKSLANKASSEGYVISYSNIGKLTVLLKVKSLQTVKISLFNNENLFLPKCKSEANIILISDMNNEYGLVDYQHTCIKDLPNGKYIIFLTTFGGEKIFKIEFEIKNGGLIN